MKKRPTIARQIIEGLEAFADALERDEDISRRFTCHKMKLDLRPTSYNPKLVKQTREALGVSQTLFAGFLGVAASTVRAWEQGTKSPQPIACRFLDEIRSDPARWRARLAQFMKPKTAC